MGDELHAEDFDLSVTPDGATHIEYTVPQENPIADLPEPPRVVSGFDVGVVEAEGDKAVLLVVHSGRGPVVLALDVVVVGSLVSDLLTTMRREF